VRKTLVAAILVIFGPTAVGKTAAALEAAGRLGAEIVSCDSMQVYRGMDIGTAKPSAEELKTVPHHLVNIVDPEERYDVARFLHDAEAAIGAIESRSVRSMLVGGTPMYLKAFLFGIFEGPAADPEMRKRLRREAGAHGTEALWQRLFEVDPDASSRIHPHDLRRIVRALEVYEKAGVPISELQNQWQAKHPPRLSTLVGLSRPRETLYRRIDERVDRMFADGLVDEVERLKERLGPTASRALGYREVLDHLQGTITLQDTIAAVKHHTHNFVRKQMTWYRSLEGVDWIDMPDGESPARTAEEIVSLAERGKE
jgi:tRNA dimethylallyltransferase